MCQNMNNMNNTTSMHGMNMGGCCGNNNWGHSNNCCCEHKQPKCMVCKCCCQTCCEPCCQPCCNKNECC